MNNKQNNDNLYRFKKKKKSKINPIVDEMLGEFQSKTDPNGSYTGIPANAYEKPVQDADDL